MAGPFEQRVGTQLAGYQLQRLVARGGMGVVYLGIHDRLHRPAAVKVLAPELAGDAVFRRRFLRECEVSVALDHPNVIPVYDAGEFGDDLYIAMRYVEGQDLHTLLGNDGRRTLEQTIALVTQIAAALDHAHSRGLVHRDVKPANVLLTGEDPPHCYLCDFGLTTFGTNSSTDLTGPTTSTGQLTGTVDYIAPERIAGNEAVPASDLYSLACLTFECLEGQPPFRRSTQLATLWAHMTQPPPSAAADRGLPASVDVVLGRGLAKDPGDRQSSCLDFARELGRTAPPQRDIRPAPRRRRWLAVAATILALIGVPLILLATRADHTAPDAGRTASHLASNHLGRITAAGNLTTHASVPAGTIGVARSDDSVWVVSVRGAVTRLDLGHQRRTTRTVPGIPTGVSATGTALWIAAGPSRSLIRLGSDGSSTATKIGACCRGPWSVAASDDGVWVASNRSVIRMAGAQRNVKRLNRSRYDANTVAVIEGGANAAPRTWLVDGQRSVWQLQWVHRPDPYALPGDEGLGWSPAAIAAGWHSVWVTAAGQVIRLHVGSGSGQRETIEIDAGSPDLIAAGPDGVWIADSAAGTVWRIHPASNTVDRQIELGSRIGAIGAADGGGVWVATTADDMSAAPGMIAFQRDGNLFVQRPDGVPRQLTEMPGVESDPTWSPDGSALAFTGDAGSGHGVYTISADGQTSHFVAAGNGTVSNPAWSPDGRTIAYVDETGTAGLYLTDSESGVARYATDVSPGSPLTWSPDGRRIAYLSAGQGEPPRVHVFSQATGQSRALSRYPAQAPAWSPDGSAIAFWTPRSGGSIVIAPSNNARQFPTELASVRTGRPSRIAWSPDGRFLAVSMSHRGDEMIVVLRNDGTRLGTLPNATSAAWGVPSGSVSFPASTS